MTRREPGGRKAMNYDGVYGCCEIVSDPDARGGFPSGAKLGGLWPMLKSGVMTPGTVLKTEGKRYQVLGPVGHQQRLVVRR